jgi:tetratricopeptide (TPR) repeat protein
VDPVSIGLVCAAAAAPTLAGLAADMSGNLAMSVLGNEAHVQLRSRLPQVYARFTRDRLPPNHDLHRATRTALEHALLSFAAGLQATTDRSIGGFGRMRAYLRRGPRFEAEQQAVRRTGEAQWLTAFRKLVANEERLAELDVISPDTARKLLSSTVHDSARTVLHDGVHAWVQRHLADAPGWPADWQRCLDEGWDLSAQGEQRVTLYQAWCLHFREAIKYRPEIFNIFVATQLADLLPEPVAVGLNGVALDAHLDSRLAGLEQALDRIEAALAQVASDVVETRDRTREILQTVKQIGVQSAAKPFAELPALPPQFLGRETELAALLQRLQAAEPPSVPITACVLGMGGVGKTALALAVGHAALAQFAGGAIFFALGAHSAAPRTGSEARRRWLEAGLAPGERLPEHESDLDRLYQRRLAAAPGRVLVLVDDPAHAADLRPLRPRTGDALLVTSRVPIAGLDALPLQALEPAAANELLRRISGRVLTEVESRALAWHCACLPIALQAAAGLLARRASKPVAELLAELAQARMPTLDRAAAGDAAMDVRAVLRYSIQMLSEPERLALHALCVMPPDFNRTIGAATAGVEADMLDALLEAGVLDYGHDTARYRLHDLLRETAVAEAAPATLDAARVRHARAVERWVHECSQWFEATWPEGQSAAMKAFLAERGHVKHAFSYLESSSLHIAELLALSRSVSDLAKISVHPRERQHWHSLGVRAAINLEDAWAEAVQWSALASAQCELGLFEQAGESTMKVFAICLKTAQEGTLEQRRAVNVAFDVMGDVHVQRGEWEDARRDYLSAYGIRRDWAERFNTPRERLELAASLDRLGRVELELGDWSSAERRYWECRLICRSVDAERRTHLSLQSLAAALINEARVVSQRFDWTRADALTQEGLALCRTLERELSTHQTRRSLALSLELTGQVACGLGNWIEAERFLQESLILRRELAHELATPDVRRDLGVTLRLLGGVAFAAERVEDARRRLLEALPIFEALAEDPGTTLARQELADLQDNLAQARGESA